jgi:hypothetical protein
MNPAGEMNRMAAALDRWNSARRALAIRAAEAARRPRPGDSQLTKLADHLERAATEMEALL